MANALRPAPGVYVLLVGPFYVSVFPWALGSPSVPVSATRPVTVRATPRGDGMKPGYWHARVPSVARTLCGCRITSTWDEGEADEATADNIECAVCLRCLSKVP